MCEQWCEHKSSCHPHNRHRKLLRSYCYHQMTCGGEMCQLDGSIVDSSYMLVVEECVLRGGTLSQQPPPSSDLWWVQQVGRCIIDIIDRSRIDMNSCGRLEWFSCSGLVGDLLSLILWYTLDDLNKKEKALPSKMTAKRGYLTEWRVGIARACNPENDLMNTKLRRLPPPPAVISAPCSLVTWSHRCCCRVWEWPLCYLRVGDRVIGCVDGVWLGFG